MEESFWNVTRPQLARLWESGMHADEIAKTLGITPKRVYQLKTGWQLPPRRRVCRSELDDPTPEQIAERAAAIRQRHLEEMRARA